jgi:hypothetical protein
MAQEGCSFLTEGVNAAKNAELSPLSPSNRPIGENVAFWRFALAVRLPASLTILSKRSPRGGSRTERRPHIIESIESAIARR